MPQDCVCPVDQHGVITHYLPTCPSPLHGQPPFAPRTNWPPPKNPCTCTYSAFGVIQYSTGCPLFGAGHGT